MKIAAAVILYNPEETILENILSYIDDVAVLYIADNSAKPSVNIISGLRNYNIVFIHDGANKGIAARLNEVAQLSIDAGFEWLLTMDQDSSFSSGTFKKYLGCVQNYAPIQNVAMLGVEYDKRLISSKDCSHRKTSELITSGSLVNLKLFHNIQGFNEKLFIDHVDHDYCFRAILKQYNIIKFDSILLTHSLGVVSYHKSLKNLRRTPRALHSPVRVYYMVRNFLYINSKYAKDFPEELRLFQKHLFNRLKNNLLYNKERLSVIKYIFKGCLDFKRNKLGKYS